MMANHHAVSNEGGPAKTDTPPFENKLQINAVETKGVQLSGMLNDVTLHIRSKMQLYSKRPVILL